MNCFFKELTQLRMEANSKNDRGAPCGRVPFHLYYVDNSPISVTGSFIFKIGQVDWSFWGIVCKICCKQYRSRSDFSEQFDWVHCCLLYRSYLNSSQSTLKGKNLRVPYKFYVLGQIGLSKQCRPRSDCF